MSVFAGHGSRLSPVMGRLILARLDPGRADHAAVVKIERAVSQLIERGDVLTRVDRPFYPRDTLPAGRGPLHITRSQTTCPLPSRIYACCSYVNGPLASLP